MKLKCTATGVVVDANEAAVEALTKAGFAPLEKKAAGKKGGKKKDEAEAESEEKQPEVEGE